MESRSGKRSQRVRIGFAVAALVGIGGGLWLALPDEQPPEAVGIASSPQKAVPRPLDKAEAAVAGPVSPPLSKSDQFEKFARTGKPDDALRAYRLVAACEHAHMWPNALKQSPNAESIQDYIASLPKPEDVCGNLSPGQRASRQQHIVKASLAGVHGAFHALVMNESPEGMIHSFVDDDAWKAIYRAALEAGLRTADPDTLLGRSSFLGNCAEEDVTKCRTDSTASLTLWVASQEARAIDQGKAVPVVDPNRYVPALTLEAATKAIDDGHAIVAAAYKRR